ncbi:MAG: PIN domain-containing protein [Gammaproteobacteria bacterium]|nr:PIN domain-containing protein [Gammaproteobacteria bacterium]
MIAQYFIDTNVLLYASSNAPDDQAQKQIARRLLSLPGIAFSAQVMQEFYDVAVRKKRLEMTHEETLAVLQALSAFPVLSIDRDLVLHAIELKAQFKISYWDAAILAAAQTLGCHTLYSEDLSHGQQYGRVKVINPFI